MDLGRLALASDKIRLCWKLDLFGRNLPDSAGNIATVAVQNFLL